jgi:hypothetical protein
MVDREAGVVDERHAYGWAKVQSMVGVMGDTATTNGDGDEGTAGFETTAGQALPGTTENWGGSGGASRVVKKPAPLALGGLSNFEPPFYGSGHGHGARADRSTRFAREDVVPTATGTPTAKGGTPAPSAGETHMHGRKTMSILQSAVIHGRANKEEVELVTGMKMDV